MELFCLCCVLDAQTCARVGVMDLEIETTVGRSLPPHRRVLSLQTISSRNRIKLFLYSAIIHSPWVRHGSEAIWIF